MDRISAYASTAGLLLLAATACEPYETAAPLTPGARTTGAALSTSSSVVEVVRPLARQRGIPPLEPAAPVRPALDLRRILPIRVPSGLPIDGR